jgi:hypothetical protein
MSQYAQPRLSGGNDVLVRIEELFLPVWGVCRSVVDAAGEGDSAELYAHDGVARSDSCCSTGAAVRLSHIAGRCLAWNLEDHDPASRGVERFVEGKDGTRM